MCSYTQYYIHIYISIILYETFTFIYNIYKSSTLCPFVLLYVSIFRHIYFYKYAFMYNLLLCCWAKKSTKPNRSSCPQHTSFAPRWILKCQSGIRCCICCWQAGIRCSVCKMSCTFSHSFFKGESSLNYACENIFLHLHKILNA